MTPAFFAVRTPGNGPSISLEDPEIRTNLPCAVNPTSANSTCDLPAILPLLSILTTFNWAAAPRRTTTLPPLFSGVTTVAQSSSPTVALSESKSVARRSTTEVGAVTVEDVFAGWLPEALL